MAPPRLYKHFRSDLRKRLSAIRKLLRRHHPLTAKEVHDLRVALRRARLLTGLGRNSVGKSESKEFRNHARALLDLLSPIRDCDVALEWLSDEAASTALIGKLRLRRERLWAARKKRIFSHKSGLKIHLHTTPHAKELQHRWKNNLADAIEETQQIVSRKPRFTAAELHGLRRIVRRWRYLYELTLKPRSQSHDQRLNRLLKIQDQLGASQNFAAILEQLTPLGHSHELKQLRARLKTAYQRSRREALGSIKTLPTSQ